MQIEINARHIALQALPKGGIGAEIGVHKGAFTQKILTIAKPKKLYAIDPYLYMPGPGMEGSLYGRSDLDQAEMDRRHQVVAKRFAKQINRSSLELLRMTSTDAAEQIADSSLDFTYIDGDHAYEGVAADLKNYFPKIKTGGLIIGDDYRNITNWWGDGVLRAFHEFIGKNARCIQIEFSIDSQICLRKL